MAGRVGRSLGLDWAGLSSGLLAGRLGLTCCALCMGKRSESVEGLHHGVGWSGWLPGLTGLAGCASPGMGLGWAGRAVLC